MATDLILHRGARHVSRDELDAVEVPPASATWFPVSHGQVLAATITTLETAGFQVSGMELALTRGNGRFFGTLNLATPLAEGVSLAVGVRNSVDKSFPLGFCAGSRVMVCDNLAFHSDLTVNRKHTRFGQERFQTAIASAVQSLGQFQAVEAKRIALLRATELSEDAANSYMLQAFEQDLVSSRLLPAVIREWRQPSFEEFRSRTLFSLLNAFTTALKPQHAGSPPRFIATTMRLQRMLTPKQALADPEAIVTEPCDALE